MKYKLIFLATVLLLMATPVYTQTKSYIVVETPNSTEPTTVLTGQAFIQTYVIRFIDLTHLGEKIVVQKESLDAKSLGEFDVLKFYIDKQVKQGVFTEHIWHVRYILRVVNPKKSAYVIPPIVIPWKHKKAGQEENDPSIQMNYEFKTEEVHVNYVTTIPEKETSLEIRDEVNFGSFKWRIWFWETVSWIFLAIPLGCLLFLALKISHAKKAGREAGYDAEDKKESEPAVVSYKTEKLSKFVTWLKLRRSIRNLKNFSRKPSADKFLEAEEKTACAIKDFLMARLPELKVGSTSLSIRDFVFAKMDKNSTRRVAFLLLADKAVVYQADVEKKAHVFFREPKDFVGEAKILAEILAELRFYNRLILFLKNKFRALSNRGRQ